MNNMKPKKCSWCFETLGDNTYKINDGEEICEDCYNHSTTCQRCGNVIHEEESCHGLCDCCYDDMAG